MIDWLIDTLRLSCRCYMGILILFLMFDPCIRLVGTLLYMFGSAFTWLCGKHCTGGRQSALAL